MRTSFSTVTFLGIQPHIVFVEVDIQKGLPSFEILGLAHTAIREGRIRIMSALKSLGYELGNRRITINLAPADIKKEGTHFDLPIALAILEALGVTPKSPQHFLAMGELGLDGSLHKVKGALMALDMAQKNYGFAHFILPRHHHPEVSSFRNVTLYPALHLSELVAFLAEGKFLEIPPPLSPVRFKKNDVDFTDVKGQYVAKRAMEIAAAGFHNILMLGPPGVGKTFLAERLATILPPMSTEEVLEVQKIHSFTSQFQEVGSCVPFRRPHHRTSYAGILGGGKPFQPGEVSLAHKGVLFLDELCEFQRDVLESLREPLELGSVRLARAEGSFELPANFLLLAASNLCPCGGLGDQSKLCKCLPTNIEKYQQKISMAIRDRIDLSVSLTRPTWEDLSRDGDPQESSEAIQRRVISARDTQRMRYDHPNGTNAKVNAKLFQSTLKLLPETKDFLEMIQKKNAPSVRSYEKILRVSRTIADLAQMKDIHANHVAEAYSLRKFVAELEG